MKLAIKQHKIHSRLYFNSMKTESVQRIFLKLWIAFERME